MNIGILFGGKSAEHEVSCISALSIYNNIDTEKFTPFLIGITKNGEFRFYENEPSHLQSGEWENYANNNNVDLLSEKGKVKVFTKSGEEILLDCIFPVLHGPFGEDGRIQGLLEYANIAYVGAGVLSSAICMDKGITKDLLGFRNIPQTKYILIKKDDDKIQERLKEISYPVFVKPANMGSSVGISKVNAFEELQQAIDMAIQFDERVIIEEGVDAREIEIAVIQTKDGIMVSSPGELLVVDEFYDYDAKYKKDTTKWEIPARLSEATIDEIKRLAKEVFEIVNCRSFARVDFFIDRKTRRVLVNEINTIPGFTPISMYPKLLIADGMSYQKIITELIERTLEEHEQKK